MGMLSLAIPASPRTSGQARVQKPLATISTASRSSMAPSSTSSSHHVATPHAIYGEPLSASPRGFPKREKKTFTKGFENASAGDDLAAHSDASQSNSRPVPPPRTGQRHAFHRGGRVMKAAAASPQAEGGPIDSVSGQDDTRAGQELLLSQQATDLGLWGSGSEGSLQSVDSAAVRRASKRRVKAGARSRTGGTKGAASRASADKLISKPKSALERASRILKEASHHGDRAYAISQEAWMHWARTSVVAFEFVKLLEAERVRLLIKVFGEDIASAPGFATGVSAAEDTSTVVAAALRQHHNAMSGRQSTGPSDDKGKENAGENALGGGRSQVSHFAGRGARRGSITRLIGDGVKHRRRSQVEA